MNNSIAPSPAKEHIHSLKNGVVSPSGYEPHSPLKLQNNTMPFLASKQVPCRKAKPHILIADSDCWLLDVVRQFLLSHGYEVEVATGGVDSLEKIRSGSALILVLDLDLQWGGGDGVLALMRDDPRLHTIPVILTSSRSVPNEECRSSPVVNLLEKPYTPDALFDAIRILRRG